ncbi:MlrC C-terminal domain-containing protein [Mesorhizobium sp. M0400]|uniref:MlrC C-terminal domain-containing protein n=1 Tax=Mesorhizobium sp. M0400 TaxID=2956941 RepID=UPI003335BE79
MYRSCTTVRRIAAQVGNIKVLLTNQPYSYMDPDYFRAVGLDPEKAKIIVTRCLRPQCSGAGPGLGCIHFQLSAIPGRPLDRADRIGLWKRSR